MLGFSMILPAIIDLTQSNPGWQIFAGSSLLTILVGGSLWVATYGRNPTLTVRGAFVITVLTWVVLAAFGALPIFWSGVVTNYTDAYFESMSGLTTTGATVLSNLDNLPQGLLFWRAMLQWLGGLGIIVMAVSILPMLQVGGMQLFKTEAFDSPEKILPSARQNSGWMTLIFLSLTMICALLYRGAGMPMMDAVMHAMTTVATGGFSSKDLSIAHFDSVLVDVIAIVFMCIGSLPFILFAKMLQSRTIGQFRDDQVKFFFFLVIIFTLIIWAYQHYAGIHSGAEGLRYAAFSVVSVMTGTGYANTDYGSWGSFPTGLFFVIMFIGGCAGSTSCGIKIFRVQVLLSAVRQHLSRLAYPNGVFVNRFNGRSVSDQVTAAVMNFFFLYLLSFAVLAVLLGLTGVDELTALSGAATAISNVGPGLGEIIGPSGNFEPLNDAAIWLLSFGMLLGRLELLTILVLFVPAFWRH